MSSCHTCFLIRQEERRFETTFRMDNWNVFICMRRLSVVSTGAQLTLSWVVRAYTCSRTSVTSYFVCKIPHTAGAILISKGLQYRVNLGDKGYQFERLVTGSSDPWDIKFTEHLLLMNVGTFRVLFSAEVDAISEDKGFPVELTVSKRRPTRVLLQMISSGSTVFCEGRTKNGSLVNISARRLSKAVDIEGQRLRCLESNILKGLTEIQQQMEGVDAGVVQKITFVESTTKLEPVGTGDALCLLPDDKVMKTLMTNSNKNI
jgi:hypothetical protein